MLDGTVSSAERQLFELRTAAADDSRILGALGDGGLLPPGPDVLATVEFLGEHGIPALPGWRYLAQAVDPADHARVLAARPELVDGVIITDPDSHTRARDSSATRPCLPRSAVAVGTAAALLAPAPAPDSDTGTGDVFLVPPNPAMHDEHAADEERHALRARATERDEESAPLAARLGKGPGAGGPARLLAHRLPQPGRLAELARTAEEARAFAEETGAELTEARTARAEADESAAEAVRMRDERREAAQKARRAADALAGLAFRLRERAGWQARLRELADEGAEAEARAQACLERARAADEDRRAARRAAGDARRTARTLRAERSEIAGAPTTYRRRRRRTHRTTARTRRRRPCPPSARPTAPPPSSTRRSASAPTCAPSRPAPRATRARPAPTWTGSATRSALGPGQLLESPDGSDGPSRQAATARAEELVQLLETRMSSASEQLGRLRGEAERLAPEDGDAHTELPRNSFRATPNTPRPCCARRPPNSPSRTEALTQAREAHAELLDTHRAAEDAAGGFDEIAAMLRDLLREHAPEDEQEEPEPYPGSLEEARQSAAEARRSLRGCAADLSAAEAAVREASDILVRHANSTRYEQVRTPARQQIRELPASALPEHAGKWADAFAPRLRVLTDELAQLERNRDSIVDRLRGLVESALATLRSAQRLSRLPEGLGEWSGQGVPAHPLRGTRPGHAHRAARRGRRRGHPSGRQEELRPAPRRHVPAAARRRRRPDAQGRRRRDPKPDAVLRAERVPVGQMGDVFSGGQLLTAAIALYCTMAALCSNDRGRDRHRHAGTLFLDNPIGRANATYLLELQRAVSHALGVQLLYTTGLFDTTALAEFPLVIRLRNDADLRAGLKYISVEEHLRPGLPQPVPAGEGEGEAVHSEITATRMYQRPAQSPA